jgi:acyl carrier protein
VEFGFFCRERLQFLGTDLSGNHGTWEVGFMTKDEIFGKVAATLTDALGVDDDQVTPEATLRGDLGAESIDFLDIVFRLEREFGIKIPRDELFPEAIFQGDPDMVKDGRITPRGINELRIRMPFADLSAFEKNPTMDAISDLFTVDAIVNYIQNKLAAAA